MLGILSLALALFVWVGGWRFFDEIDRCLDAGGGWNHEVEACEYTDAPRGNSSRSISDEEHAVRSMGATRTTALLSLDGKGGREAGG